jgi:hypothetical protein
MDALIKKSRSLVEIILIDLLTLILLYFIPFLTHVSPFTLYYTEPMRLMALAVFFLTGNHRNGVAIALTLPFFSMLFSGHPIPAKALLISVELSVNIILLHLILDRFNKYGFILILGSIIISKTLYYLLKFIFIKTSLLSGSLFSIPVQIQIITAIITAAVFHVVLAGGRKS